MSVSNVNCGNSVDEIGLYDIWYKLVVYKKTFWAIFCMVLLIGAIVFWVTPERYKFTQLFEVGKYLNSNLVEVPLMEDKELLGLVESIYLTEATGEYQAGVDNKINLDVCKNKISIIYLGGRSFTLSARDRLDNAGFYRVVFQSVIGKLAAYKADEVDLFKKNLESAKKNVEGRLHYMNVFYERLVGGKKDKDVGESINLTDRVVNMYISDQQTMIMHLIEKLNSIQAQFEGIDNTKLVNDFVIEKVESPSKIVLLILGTIASFFFALFGVFVVDFLAKLGIHKPKETT